MSIMKVIRESDFKQAMSQKRLMERQRAQAIEECRAHGRMGGSDRLPLAVASDPDLSDTVIQKCYIALEEGREQRIKDLLQRGVPT